MRVRAVNVHSPLKFEEEKKVVTSIEKTVLELLPLCKTCDDLARVKAFRENSDRDGEAHERLGAPDR